MIQPTFTYVQRKPEQGEEERKRRGRGRGRREERRSGERTQWIWSDFYLGHPPTAQPKKKKILITETKALRKHPDPQQKKNTYQKLQIPNLLIPKKNLILFQILVGSLRLNHWNPKILRLQNKKLEQKNTQNSYTKQ